MANPKTQIILQFKEEGYIEAEMSLGELKAFLDRFGYEYDEPLEEIGSFVQLGTHGGVKYFTPQGEEIVVAWNEGGETPDFPEQVVQWLMDHDIPIYFYYI